MAYFIFTNLIKLNSLPEITLRLLNKINSYYFVNLNARMMTYTYNRI